MELRKSVCGGTGSGPGAQLTGLIEFPRHPPSPPPPFSIFSPCSRCPSASEQVPQSRTISVPKPVYGAVHSVRIFNLWYRSTAAQ